jgi:Mrp family chromosome partitioning ATPase
MSTARSIVSEAVVLAVGVAAAALSLRSEARLYEATRTLELAGAVLSAEETKLHTGSDVDGSAVRMVERLASQLAERDRQHDKRGKKLGFEKRCSVKIVGIRRLSLSCRADTATTAQQHCDRLGRETIAMVNALRMLPESAPVMVGRALPGRLRALALGAAAGLSWILLRLVWRQRTLSAAHNPAARQSVPPSPSPARDSVQMRTAVASVAPAKPEVPAPQRAVIVTPAPAFVATDRSAQRAAPHASTTAAPATVLSLSASNTGPTSSEVNGSPTPPSASNPQTGQLEPPGQLKSSGGVRSTRPTRRLELDRTAQGAGPHAGNPRPVQGEVVIDSPVDATSWREASRAANPVSTVLAQEAESRWAPDREVVAAAPLAELTKLSEELFRLASRGGVLVRIASGPECERVKSEVAAQLAWMLAERGSARVLLLEADFERPAVQRVMKVEIPAFKGFSQQLHQRATSGTRATWSVLRCAPSLNVLAEGRVRTLGLLDSAEFSVALAELRRYYDVIIADGPVNDSGVDSRALDGVADSIVYVTTSGAAVSATLELISQTYGDRELVWVVRTAAAPKG